MYEHRLSSPDRRSLATGLPLASTITSRFSAIAARTSRTYERSSASGRWSVGQGPGLSGGFLCSCRVRMRANVPQLRSRSLAFATGQGHGGGREPIATVKVEFPLYLFINRARVPEVMGQGEVNIR